MSEVENIKLKKFQKLIKYEFKNEILLKQALTTPQKGNEDEIPHYDQLEILGDSILKTILIFKKYKENNTDPENITKTKQAIENNNTLSFIARKYFNLNAYIFRSEKQEIEGTNILADVFEAICAAIFLDSDLNISVVEKKIIDFFYKDWDVIIKDTVIFNKNMLLEYLQKLYRITPKIILEYEKNGPDHDPKWIAKNPKVIDLEGKVLHYFMELKSKPFRNKTKAEQNLYMMILGELKKLKVE